MTNLFERIRVEVESNPDGWTTVETAQILACLIMATRPKLVLEIGVWSGRSLIPQAMALQTIGSGQIIGIDPWNAKASAEGQTGDHLKWWSEVDHEMIYQRFTSRLVHSGAALFASIHRCRSDEFKLKDIGEIDILHVDGNHGEECSCYDITHFAPKVKRGGYLFMDDVEWARKAAGAIQDLGFQTMYSIGSEVMYQRI